MSNPYKIIINITKQNLCVYKTEHVTPMLHSDMNSSVNHNGIDTFAYEPLEDYLFLVSSAEKGIGQLKGSYQTPLGKHIIRAKIGEGAPINTVFVGRRPTGEIYNSGYAKMPENKGRDWILTRILWLSGKEVGKNRLGNCDTMQRYIYIHGTPDEVPLGTPGSHGCIRMHNQDILKLFSLVPVYTPVEIVL